jgi:hypothetical protein
LIGPWISDGLVLVTWLTMVRAFTPTLFRSAPAEVTLNEEYVLFETPPTVGARVTVWWPDDDALTPVAVPPSGTMPAARTWAPESANVVYTATDSNARDVCGRRIVACFVVFKCFPDSCFL